jgi:hypothetical protein
MEATGALPTEKRVREMNNYQWLWYYVNIMERKKKDIEERDNIIQYMAYFWNYDMAKSVADQRDAEKRKRAREERRKNGTETQYDKYEERNVLEEGEVYNDTFDDEIEAILEKEKKVELPGSSSKSSTETKEEFMERAFTIEKMLKENPNLKEFQYIEPQAKKLKRKKKEEMMAKAETTKVRNNGERPLLINPKKAKKPSMNPMLSHMMGVKNESSESSMNESINNSDEIKPSNNVGNVHNGNMMNNNIRNNVNNHNHHNVSNRQEVSNKPVMKTNNEIVGFKKTNEVEDLLSFDKFKSNRNDNDLDIITSPTNEK